MIFHSSWSLIKVEKFYTYQVSLKNRNQYYLFGNHNIYKYMYAYVHNSFFKILQLIFASI